MICPQLAKMIGRTATFVALVAFLGVALVGCTGGSTSDKNVALAASSRPYDASIPVPVGFELINASENGLGGRLRHRYGGRADIDEVRRFYEREMPLMRWSEVSDRVDRRIVKLRFRRGAEACTIVIEGTMLGFGHRLQVDVVVDRPVDSQPPRGR